MHILLLLISVALMLYLLDVIKNPEKY
ncbi:potassium-transporting ATPase subunit F [Aliidiomarina iranensis]